MKGPPGICRLHLCCGHPCLLAVRCLGRRAVEASHGVVHGTLEGDRQDGLLALGKLLVEGEGAALVLLIVADVGGFDARIVLAGLDGNLGRVKLELVGIECDGLGGFLYGKIDCNATLV